MFIFTPIQSICVMEFITALFGTLANTHTVLSSSLNWQSSRSLIHVDITF